MPTNSTTAPDNNNRDTQSPRPISVNQADRENNINKENTDRVSLSEDIKTQSVIKRTFKSPTFWLLSLALLSGLTAPFALGGHICHILLPAKIACAVVAIGSLVLSMSIFKYKKPTIKYETSLFYTLLRNFINKEKQPWYSKIEGKLKNNQEVKNIYLGGIPLKNKNHIQEFKDLKINSILSLLEDFEYQQTPISDPITTEDWEKKDITQCKINAKDFIPLEMTEIDEAVKFLKDEIDKGKIVYVHCKAGKGRSVTAVCCYLIKEKDMTADDAIAFVKEKRPNINLNSHQKARIQEYYEKIQEEKEKKKTTAIFTEKKATKNPKNLSSYISYPFLLINEGLKKIFNKLRIEKKEF